MGFPGGVAWAMLVARVCQLYPQATSSTILDKFFRIIGKWPWPRPVLLKAIEDGPLNARVWNPKVDLPSDTRAAMWLSAPQIYTGDRYHLMPIITPAYPSMCATHNVSLSTKAIISREMERAAGIVDQIVKKQLQWGDLFTRHCFFTKGYKYYLSIVAASRTRDAQLIWSGLVESKVRLLVTSLENLESVELAHPFIKGFDRVHRCRTEEEVEKIVNGDTHGPANEVETFTTNLKAEAKHNGDGDTNGADPEAKPEAAHMVYTTTYYIGIELALGQ